MPQEVTVKQLLEAGVHFGHHTNRWNPKMAPYIFTDRNKVYIIDLEKTLKHLGETCKFLRALAEHNGTILLVGTKRQAQQVIHEIAQKTEMPYVNQRWLGGMLTNFETIRKSVARLEALEKMEAEGTYQFLTKKEVAALRTQREKLLKVLVGVRHMKRLPEALFIVDPEQEKIAVREARRLGIPVAAIIDTNCNPDLIDYPIPGNDDAIRSVRLICEVVGQAIEEGRNRYKQVSQEKELAASVQEQLEAEAGNQAQSAAEPEAAGEAVEEPAHEIEEDKAGSPAKTQEIPKKAKRGRTKKGAKEPG